MAFAAEQKRLHDDGDSDRSSSSSSRRRIVRRRVVIVLASLQSISGLSDGCGSITGDRFAIDSGRLVVSLLHLAA